MQQSRTISHKYFTFDVFFTLNATRALANKYKQQSLTIFQAFFSGHSETRLQSNSNNKRRVTIYFNHAIFQDVDLDQCLGRFF